MGQGRQVGIVKLTHSNLWGRCISLHCDQCDQNVKQMLKLN